MSKLEKILLTIGYGSPEYWRAVRVGSKIKPETDAEPEPYPAPEHTTNDPWPDDFTLPRAVATVRSAAKASGWVVAQTYSRGRQPHKRLGIPGAPSHWVALRMFHPETRARAVMVYAIRVEDGTRGWDSILLTLPGTIISGANVTEVREFLLCAGRVLPGWIGRIKRRGTSGDPA